MIQSDWMKINRTENERSEVLAQRPNERLLSKNVIVCKGL
jgi:hypothetical protein